MKKFCFCLFFISMSVFPAGYHFSADGNESLSFRLPDKVEESKEEPQVITNSEKGLWERDQKAELIEELVIGKEYGDEWEMFNYIRKLAFDDQNRIYVADSMDLAVRVFDETGKFLHQFGREGEGPGEFQTLDDIHWCASDGMIYIVDRRNHRISRFTPEGKPIDSIKDTHFNASIEGLNSLKNGSFVLTARVRDEQGISSKLLITDKTLKTVLKEILVDFPIHDVGIKFAPIFSDVGVINDDRIYYTSPSEYKIVVLNQDYEPGAIVRKSHPRMFLPQYVQGFYADFNTLESLFRWDEFYILGIHSTEVANIPRFETKKDFLRFYFQENLQEPRHPRNYQLDIFNDRFQFLGSVRVPQNRRFAGIDSKKRLYLIENDPYPRTVRCRLEIKET